MSAMSTMGTMVREMSGAGYNLNFAMLNPQAPSG